MYLDELFDMVESKWAFDEVFFAIYIASLFLHSHSHQTLWKWLEISPMAMVYVIYITNLGIVDGLK